MLLLLKDYYYTWTDPTRVKSPQSGRTPLRVKTPTHNVDRPNKGQKLKQVHEVDGHHEGSRPQSTTWTDPIRVKNLSPQSGQTPRRVKTPVHNVDGPNKGQKLKQVHKVDGHHEIGRAHV